MIMTGLVGLREQCKGRQWAEGWWASPGSSPWPLSPCCGDTEGKNTLTFLFKAFYWRMALVQTNTVEYMTMQSTSDVWSMMAISGHWRPPIANRLWIHQHLWFPFSQNSINTRCCQYCVCLFPLHEFEVFDTMFSFVGAWPFYARHVLYTPRRALTHLYRRGQSEQNLLRPKNWRRFL